MRAFARIAYKKGCLQVIKRFLGALICVSIILSSLASCASSGASDTYFTWDNATVYFLLTDRFNNGNTKNDNSYGRGLDADGNIIDSMVGSAGSFHGGDFAGITDKLKDGYFNDLGVNAIWITPPYEQIHGYRSGDGFAFYAYHGYWALDYSVPDANYGTEAEFRKMVDTAHSKGIRVIMDIVLNHAGYPTMLDASEYGFGEYVDAWENYYYGDESSLDEGSENSRKVTSSTAWQNWWGADWIRSNDIFPGYENGGAGEKLQCLSGLPDFKTESTKVVSLPPILTAKWTAEGRLEREQQELESFFEKYSLEPTVLNHQIKWLTDWVREYGIDGFRCDTAKHVDLTAWTALENYATLALEQWKAENHDKTLDDTPFWMVGEVWDHGVKKDTYFTEGSFDALINFSFRKNAVKPSNMPEVYTLMAQRLVPDKDFNMLSYLSSHDTALYARNDLIQGANMLLMAPGAVQIFYGDESARPRAFDDNPYADQRLRGFMNWNMDDTQQQLLKHWQILGTFRQAHPAIGAGEHTVISDEPYIFSRSFEDENDFTDTVIVVFADANTALSIDVSSVFKDGIKLHNYYDKTTSTVADGHVKFNSGENGIILIEIK